MPEEKDLLAGVAKQVTKDDRLIWERYEKELKKIKLGTPSVEQPIPETRYPFIEGLEQAREPTFPELMMRDPLESPLWGTISRAMAKPGQLLSQYFERPFSAALWTRVFEPEKYEAIISQKREEFAGELGRQQEIDFAIKFLNKARETHVPKPDIQQFDPELDKLWLGYYDEMLKTLNDIKVGEVDPIKTKRLLELLDEDIRLSEEYSEFWDNLPPEQKVGVAEENQAYLDKLYRIHSLVANISTKPSVDLAQREAQIEELAQKFYIDPSIMKMWSETPFGELEQTVPVYAAEELKPGGELMKLYEEGDYPRFLRGATEIGVSLPFYLLAWGGFAATPVGAAVNRGLNSVLQWLFQKPISAVWMKKYGFTPQQAKAYQEMVAAAEKGTEAGAWQGLFKTDTVRREVIKNTFEMAKTNPDAALAYFSAFAKKDPQFISILNDYLTRAATLKLPGAVEASAGIKIFQQNMGLTPAPVAGGLPSGMLPSLPVTAEKWAIMRMPDKINLVESLKLPSVVASKAWGALTEAERATLTITPEIAPEAVGPPGEVVAPEVGARLPEETVGEKLQRVNAIRQSKEYKATEKQWRSVQEEKGVGSSEAIALRDKLVALEEVTAPPTEVKLPAPKVAPVEVPVPVKPVEVAPPVAPAPKTLTAQLKGLYSEIGVEVKASQAALGGLRGEEAKIARTTLKMLEGQLKYIDTHLKTMADIEAVRPIVKQLRQQIMAVSAYKGLPNAQRRRLFESVTGKAHLTKMNQSELEEVLAKVRDARPVKIKGATVVKADTERAIQNLKSTLIEQGKLNEPAYSEIRHSLGLTTDRYENAELFITQKEAKQLIRNINYEAEVGLIEYDNKVIEALKAKPNVAKAIETLTKRIEAENPSIVKRVRINWGKLAVEVTEEPALHGINPFFDIQIAIQRLQEKVGGRAVTRISDVFEMAQVRRLHLERVARLMDEKIAKSVPGFRQITTDKKALERIRLYIAAKNDMAGIKSPPDISEQEINLANAIEKEWQGWQNQLRHNRFSSSYYQHDGDLLLMQKDIPNAPRTDLREAISIYESQGNEALRTYLDTKTWGIIRQGYEFRQLLKVDIMPRRAPKVVFGKSQLKTRTDMTYTPQEKDVLQRLRAYRRRMLNSELEPYFRKIDIEFAKITPRLANVEKEAGKLSLALEELKGFYVQEIAAQIMLRLGGISFSILSLSPHMFVRNLFQNPALLPDKSSLIDPRNRWLTDQELEYIDIEVNQFSGIKQEQLLQRYMGQTRPERLLAKLTYYPYSDPINRKGAMFATVNKAERALKAFQKDGDVEKFMRNSGMLEMSSTEQIKTLEMLAQDQIKYRSPTLRPVSGGSGAVREIGKFITTRKHFRYIRFQRSLFEMGVGGRIVGSLVAFPRGYAQNLFLAFERAKPGPHTTGAEKYRAMKVITAVILGALIFGELYKKATGKPRNPYHPLQVLTWSPGGLAVGAPMAIADTWGTLSNILMAEDEEQLGWALNQLTKDVPRMGDMFIPFYGTTMNILEAAYDKKFIDRETLRRIREIFDESYETNEEFYVKERSWLGKFQHAIFGGEEPDPSAIEVAIKDLETAEDKLGKIDRGEIFTTRDLSSVYFGSLKQLDADLITEEDGFSPLTVFWAESDRWFSLYYDLPDAQRDKFLEDNPYVVTLLYFWGRWKANIPDNIRQGVEIEASKYKVPSNAIPALGVQGERGGAPTAPSSYEEELRRIKESR